MSTRIFSLSSESSLPVPFLSRLPRGQKGGKPLAKKGIEAFQTLSKEDVVREFRMREILAAARRVIADHGFQGATIDRVAEEARIAKGTVYLYFDNKDDLLQAAMEEGLISFGEQIRAEVAQVDDPLEKLRRLVTVQLEIMDANQDFIKALMVEHSLVDPSSARPGAQRLVEHSLAHLRFIAGIVGECVVRGVMRKVDPEAVAVALNETIRGYFQRRLLEPGWGSGAHDADTILDIFFHGLLNHKRHPR
jgi:TetR/AcrR family fatty acid metabolism transcriptional regulator